MYNFNRGQYGKPALTDRQAPFIAQVEMWWLYFRWQWLRDPFDSHQPAENARDALPAARRARRLRPLEAGQEIVLVLRSADADGDARAHLLHELQVRRVAVAGAGRHRRRAKYATATTSICGVFGLERLGSARAVYVWETIAALISRKNRAGEEALDLPAAPGASWSRRRCW